MATQSDIMDGAAAAGAVESPPAPLWPNEALERAMARWLPGATDEERADLWDRLMAEAREHSVRGYLAVRAHRRSTLGG